VSQVFSVYLSWSSSSQLQRFRGSCASSGALHAAASRRAQPVVSTTAFGPHFWEEIENGAPKSGSHAETSLNNGLIYPAAGGPRTAWGSRQHAGLVFGSRTRSQARETPEPTKNRDPRSAQSCRTFYRIDHHRHRAQFAGSKQAMRTGERLSAYREVRVYCGLLVRQWQAVSRRGLDSCCVNRPPSLPTRSHIQGTSYKCASIGVWSEW